MNINIKSAFLFSFYSIVLQIVKCESLFIYKGQYTGTFCFILLWIMLFVVWIGHIVLSIIPCLSGNRKCKCFFNYTITRKTGLVLSTTLFVIVYEFPVVKCYVLPHSIGNCFVEIDDIINDFLRDKLVNYLSMTEIIYLLQVVLLFFFFLIEYLVQFKFKRS